MTIETMKSRSKNRIREDFQEECRKLSDARRAYHEEPTEENLKSFIGLLRKIDNTLAYYND